MASRVFADPELEELRKFPEIGRDELFRFFMHTQTLVENRVDKQALRLDRVAGAEPAQRGDQASS